MKNEKTKIIDESGDRKYFTQIPNMIVNHSTAYEQSLYLIMKRLAGEHGSCFASLNFLSEKMGIHKTTVSKTIKKLLKRAWIKEIEKKKVRGGIVRQFVIVDLWKINIKEYESGAEMTTKESGAVVDGSGAVVDGSGAQSDTKKNYEEDLMKKTLTKKLKEETSSFGNEDINILVKYLSKLIGGSLDGSIKENRNYAHLILGRFKKDYPNRDSVELIKMVIERGVADRFHAKNLTNFKYLFYNAQKIIQSAKSDLNKNHITKIS